VNAVDEARGSTMFHGHIVSEEARPVGATKCRSHKLPKVFDDAARRVRYTLTHRSARRDLELGAIVGPQASVPSVGTHRLATGTTMGCGYVNR
jgi:hypothetical protein